MVHGFAPCVLWAHAPDNSGTATTHTHTTTHEEALTPQAIPSHKRPSSLHIHDVIVWKHFASAWLVNTIECDSLAVHLTRQLALTKSQGLCKTARAVRFAGQISPRRNPYLTTVLTGWHQITYGLRRHVGAGINHVAPTYMILFFLTYVRSLATSASTLLLTDQLLLSTGVRLSSHKPPFISPHMHGNDVIFVPDGANHSLHASDVGWPRRSRGG